MGKQITAKRAGTCPKCQKSWDTGDKIHWDNSVKNSANFSVVCIDEDCFKSQGGRHTPSYQPRNNGEHRYASKQQVDVTLKLPSVTVDSKISGAGDKLKQYIVEADKLVEELYDLPPNDQTRGQIRSKFIDQLIAISKGN